jgi:hypothetical protein
MRDVCVVPPPTCTNIALASVPQLKLCPLVSAGNCILIPTIPPLSVRRHSRIKVQSPTLAGLLIVVGTLFVTASRWSAAQVASRVTVPTTLPAKPTKCSDGSDGVDSLESIPPSSWAAAWVKNPIVSPNRIRQQSPLSHIDVLVLIIAIDRPPAKWSTLSL